MEEEAVLIKKGNEKRRVEKHGKLYRMMIKSNKMEVIISELDIQKLIPSGLDTMARRCTLFFKDPWNTR